MSAYRAASWWAAVTGRLSITITSRSAMLAESCLRGNQNVLPARCAGRVCHDRQWHGRGARVPAFGEVDFDVLKDETRRFEPGEGPDLICAVAPDGKFTAEAPDYEGRWVKEADRDITRDLRRRGLLFHQEQYLHEYPFCWRAEEDPLIQYPRQSWFIRTTQFKEAMIANNQQINWLPAHIKEGRFGNFLESNVDWALSPALLGTPLPIWVCSATGKAEAVGSYRELLAKPGLRGTEVWEQAKRTNPGLSDHLKVHKPYIDAITYASPYDSTGTMRA